MPIKMYDLAGADAQRRFSPYCWRIKLALKHKGLEFDTIPWRFADKSIIAPYHAERVPVIVDGGRAVADSWKIAQYLDDTYAGRPSLFGGEEARSLARFYNQWADVNLHAAIAPIVVGDILKHLDPGDQDYFRESREARLGTTLEALAEHRESHLATLERVLEPLRQTLASQLYLGGSAALYPDYIVFGAFQWGRAISAVRLLKAEDPIEAWRQRMLDAFGGLARSAPGYW